MKYIIKNGSSIRIIEATNIQEKLPLGTYNLEFNKMMGYYLNQVSDLEVPNKIYGDMSIVDRSIEVYKNRDRNFGLMLYGLKGSGKTLAMRLIAKKLNQPVIIINSNFDDTGSVDAISFLSDKTLGDCTILIDEYEKKFSRTDDTPLTLLDGPYPTHHFFILTANDNIINENMRNRPGRIYYTVKYSGLEDSIINEVASDLLDNKEYINELSDICEDIPNLSFDMLISIIKDCNLFNESPKQVIKWFGFSKESQYATIYQVFNNKLIDTPIIESMYLNNSSSNYEWVDVRLSPGHKLDESMNLRFNSMRKIRKNVYRIVDYITPEDIREQSDVQEKDKIKKQLETEGVVFEPNSYKVKLEFEVHMSSTPKINYIY